VPSSDLGDLVAPGAVALVTQECQRAVVGDRAVLGELATAAAPAVAAAGRLAHAARSNGVPVVHCVVERRPDGLGSNDNARLFSAVADRGIDLVQGGEGVQIVPELGPEPEDLVLGRLHGVGPMGGTDLDPVLRNLGIDTIVAVGVSLNVGLTSLVLDAVNAGYRVVVPRDAVAGVPPEYGEAVLEHTLALLATLTEADAVVAAWAGV
jgi:nicotinamidase-related amidase